MFSMSCQYLDVENNVCLDNVPATYYIDNITQNTIKSCNSSLSNCSTCLNALQCLSCLNNKTISYSNNTNICVEICPSGFHQNTLESINICSPCSIVNCSNCSINPSQCSQCYDNKYLDIINFRCYEYLPLRYHLVNMTDTSGSKLVIKHANTHLQIV